MTQRPARAIIIAAGRGRRLMPYTDEMPKCMVPVDGRSILEVQLQAFVDHGVREVVIIRGYLGDVLTQRCAELGPSLGIDIRFVDNHDWEHNNILESLFTAEHELAGPLLMTYSDIIFTPQVVGDLLAGEGDIRLVIDQDFRDIYEGRDEHPLSEAEVSDLNPAGTVARVGKRALPADEAWGEFIGLAMLSAAGADAFRSTWGTLVDEYRGREQEPFVRAPSFRVAYLTDLLQHLIDGGQEVIPVGIRGQWREIDTVQDLQRARQLLGFAKENSWK